MVTGCCRRWKLPTSQSEVDRSWQRKRKVKKARKVKMMLKVLPPLNDAAAGGAVVGAGGAGWLHGQCPEEGGEG